jgi:hypothetical protein
VASVPTAAPAAKSLKALSEIAAVRFPLFQIFGDAKIGGRIAPRRPHKIVNVSTAAMHTPCPRWVNNGLAMQYSAGDTVGLPWLT